MQNDQLKDAFDSPAELPCTFTLADAAALSEQMPTLTFAAQTDSRWAKTPEVQSYLNYYRINFAGQDPSLSHGFGRISAAGFDIATHYWLPPKPRGTLVIMHGYYDHVGIFNHAIAFGLAQEFAVLAFDLPGHGLSSGERVAIDSFDQYADVLNTILTATQPLLPAPYAALGQSTGGSVLLNYLWRYEAARTAPLLSRIALCAPLVLPRGWGTGRFLYALVHRFIKRIRRGHSLNSHNPDFIRFINEQDCLQSPSLSVRWVGAMKAWDQQFCAYPQLDTPLLVLQGTADQTVEWRYNLKQVERKLPSAEIHLIENAGHQLVNESDEYRQQVFAKLQEYFCKLA